MSEVWVVTGTSGEYSDRVEWVTRVFSSEQEAQVFVEFLTEQRQKLGQRDYDYTPKGMRAMEAVEQAMRAFDPNYSEDYTGTSWYVSKAPFGPLPAPPPSAI